MTDKVNRMPSLTGSNVKPVPMRLFDAWEVDRTPPNCVLRLCSLTLSRLVVLKPLGSDISTIRLAVKMQSSKRTLRSNEITLPTHGLLDIELELSFVLQYPHYLKQEGNKLQIMLQRRKRYKNRTILGFKTLAMGAVNMAMALQRQMDIELELHSESKADKNGPVAKVTVQSLSSQPVDHEESVERLKNLSLGDNTERGNVVDFRYADDDDDDDFTSNEEGSDSEPLGLVDNRNRVATRKASRNKILPANARQRNLKQKFIALLKRFKITEDLQGLEHDEAGGMDATKLTGADLEMDAGDIEDLIDELEDLSDSGPEMDTLSVTSTPKPSLRPFFASSRSLAHDPSASAGVMGSHPARNEGYGRLERHYSDESSKRAPTDSDSHAEVWTDQEQSDTPTTTTTTTTTAMSASSPPKQSQDDKTKESRRSRLFARERTSTSSANSTARAKDAALVGRTEAKDRDKDRLTETSPRKMLLEQLLRCMPADDAIPDHVILVNGADCLAGCNLAARLVERQQRVVCTGGAADVRATVGCLVNKIQKFRNSSAKQPPPIKVVLVGSDSYVNSILRSYVEQFSSKPPDWQNHIKFYIVPFGSGPTTLSRYLASQDRFYSANFASDSWREAVVERCTDSKLSNPPATAPDPGASGQSATPASTASLKVDIQEVIHRLGRYLNSDGAVLQVPIAEAIITYREASSEEETTQVFIPFVSEVRIGIADPSPVGVDVEDGQFLSGSSAPSAGASSSPPQQNSAQPAQQPAATLLVNLMNLADGKNSKEREDKEKDKDKSTKERITPPSSPNISAIYGGREASGSSWPQSASAGESVELQVDYWLSAYSAAAKESAAASVASAALSTALAVKKEKGESVKYTLKAGFRWIVIKRLPPNGSDNATASLFTMTFGVKEKKQKIDFAVMRLGKKKEKDKEVDMKSEMVSGINRLVCQAKTHHSLLKVVIDGVEWNNVKFFQLSSQWQTHIRYLPVALFTDSAF